MQFRLAIITCPGRESVLRKTLDSIRASDYTDYTNVYCDHNFFKDKKFSQTQNALNVLIDSAKDTSQWDYLLFCEDDIVVHPDLVKRCTEWITKINESIRLKGPIEDTDHLLVGSLYNTDSELGYPSTVIGGSQCIVIERHHILTILEQWPTFTTEMQDLRIYRTVPFVYICQPNLVDHQQVPSTWGGPDHRSLTYANT